MKRIGFLSFGHWGRARGSRTQSAGDALLQTVELARVAEALGVDSAFVRVHHFARQLAAPFPLLAAIAAQTSRIEIGTGVIDIRYENPLYMAEEAAAADLISGGRLQLGISRGSPEPALRGAEAFGYRVYGGQADAGESRKKLALFRAAIAGEGIAPSDPACSGGAGMLPIQPQSPGLDKRIWWGSSTRESAVWVAEQGMNLMSSTLLLEDTGVPFDELQAEQIAVFRGAWAAAGWSHASRVSVSRSVIPVVTDEDREYFGSGRSDSSDQLGHLDGAFARFGRGYTGEPDVIAEELARDAAVQSADTLLLTIPNQLGVEYNTRLLKTIVEEIAPAIGWRPRSDPARASVATNDRPEPTRS
jgi:alkanesulfonate monooxygenase SsuD/methylene tetrahydromethanopterin reductase-like flavin-dependent oxidoreductase (luciferase family)